MSRNKPPTTSSLPLLRDPNAPPPPLLSYPLQGSALVVSSNPALWAQQTAWDIREHDFERFLEAQHGAKIEDFWTKEFIEARGREYCELVLKYIIMFNHEEVGGYAVMFIDQMLMWQPHYFPYAMKYRCNVDELFGRDQIAHYDRKFLEMVVIWCKSTYTHNQDYWDKLLANPPTGNDLEVFIKMVEDHHVPQKLKEMHIVPKEREDDWPVNYFARARGKLPIPEAQMEEEAQLWTQNVTQGDNSASPSALCDVDGGSDSSALPDADLVCAPAQAVSDAYAGDPTSGYSGSQGEKAGMNDGEGSDFDNENHDRQIRKVPQSPRGKKAVKDEEDVSTAQVPKEAFHRRVKSESDSPVKRPGLSLKDWMTAPGAERRAISTEAQSQMLDQARQRQPTETRRIPHTGRGGAHAAIGRYQYGPGSAVPTFFHPYTPDAVAQNNAAYLYHQDHNFGRSYPPLPDHATTYRPGSNIYRTDPQHGDMFVPVAHPQPHFSYPAHVHAHAHNQMGYIHPQAGGPVPGAAYGGPSPQIGQLVYPNQMIQSPQTVHTALHGVVPHHIMAPYVQLAATGVRPQHESPLSQVGQPSRFPGYLPMRHPTQHIQRGATNAPVCSPRRPTNVPHASPHSTIMQQINAVRGSGQKGTPHTVHRNPRRALVRSEPVQYSPQAPSFRPSGTYQQNSFTAAKATPITSATGVDENNNHAHRAATTTHTIPRHAPEGSLPFPSYMDEMVNPANLPEGAQCTSNSIGPDAEDVVTLWFADIPKGSTTEQLRSLIEHTMPVADIKDPITFDQKSSYEKGWTFVRFHSNENARTALAHFHGRPFNGGLLKVQVPERRTKQGRRKSSRFQGHGYGQSSDHTDGFPSGGVAFGGGSTPGAQAPVIGASPGARRLRGSSLSQANHAVCRNNTFTKQDARSDLPLADLPEMSEYTNLATPIAGVPEADAEGPIDGFKKPGKKKKKPKKSMKKSASRNASAAPSDSNISSVPEASGNSRERAVHEVAATEEPESKPTDKPKTCSSTKAVEREPVPALTNSDSSDTAIEPVVEPTPAVSKEDNPVDEVVPSRGKDGTVVAAIIPPSHEEELQKIASPKVEPPATLTDLTNVGGQDVTHFELDGSSTSAPLIPNSYDSTDELVQAAEEVKIEANDLPAVNSTSNEQTNVTTEAVDKTSSVTDVGDARSDATLVTQSPPPPASVKVEKKKGPAQTESLYAFGTLTKSQKKAAKIKAKKERERQASMRKASKPLAGPSDITKTTVEEPKTLMATESSEAMDTEDKDLKVDNSTQDPVGPQSSPLYVTPPTKTHPSGPRPSSPTPGGTGMMKIESTGDLGKNTKAGDDVAAPGQSRPDRSRSFIGGRFQSISNNHFEVAGPTVHPQPSQSASCTLPVENLLQPKKTNSAAVVPKTWAQVTKGKKNTGSANDSNETGLGLSERDVNVPR